MGNVIKILEQFGKYIYRNSVWLIPLVEGAIRTVKKIIKTKKDERDIKDENQNGIGEVGQDSELLKDCGKD